MPYSSRNLLAYALLGVLLLAPSVAAQGPSFVPGEVCLRLDPAIPDRDQTAVVTSYGLRIRHHYRLLRAFWVEAPGHEDIPSLCEHLEADPRVRFAHPNWFGVRHGGPVVPNDPGFSGQYTLDNTGQIVNGQVGTADADIDAPEAWGIRTDATSVLIAVVDSGCHLVHPDIIGNVWQNPVEPIDGIDNDGNGLVDDRYGWDWANNDNIPDDVFGHGTWATGVIAARGDNGVGVAGVCWQARVVALKDGDVVPQAAMSAAAIEYAAAHDAAVINFSTEYPAAAAGIIGAAIDAADAADCVVTVSAGNWGTNIEGGALNVPAEFTTGNLLVVGACDNQDQRAGFSNWGSISVDVAAGGVQVDTVGLGSSYASVDGTSFSAPIAAGCIALMRAHDPTLSHQAVIALLLSAADPVAAWSGLTVTGARINLHAALSQVVPTTPFALSLTDLGGGMGTLSVANATPNATLFIPVSQNPAFPVGSGPLLGLPSDALISLLTPIQPFHALADGNGAYTYTAGGLPAGLGIQVRAVEFDPALGIVQLSNIATLIL
ncbi:MAG: S8 family serine peptidase [Planctomycetes bacterium]|nr:S8 family serine peptidase [Planctomycetota bacterium]